MKNNIHHKYDDLDLDFFLNYPDEDIEFVIHGFQKGTVGLLTAPGSTGKGMLTIQMLLAIADETGTLKNEHMDFVKMHGKIGYLSFEDNSKVLAKRIKGIVSKYGIDKNNKVLSAIKKNFYIRDLVGSGVNFFGVLENYTAATNQKHIDELKDFCKDKILVVIDTLTRVHVADENSNGQMSGLLRVFENIANETGCSILLTHHSSKQSQFSGEQDNQASARGASALVDNARFQISMSKMTKEQQKKFDVNDDERHWYVQLDFPKINYDKPVGKTWFKRSEGGVLIFENPPVKEVQDGFKKYDR